MDINLVLEALSYFELNKDKEEADFISKMPLYIVKIAYGDCKSVEDVCSLTRGFVELRRVVRRVK